MLSYNRIYENCGDSDGFEKYALYTMDIFDMKIYDKTMRDFLRKEFEVDSENLLIKWARKCWNCKKVFILFVSSPLFFLAS